MPNGDQSNPRLGLPEIPKAEWWKIIIEVITDPIKLLALVALAVFLVLIFGVVRDRVSDSVFTILAGVLVLIVVAAVVVAFKRPTTERKRERQRSDKFKQDSGPHRIQDDGRREILGAEKSRPELDTWYRKLRPTLHQASFYTVPTYYLDTDLNVLDYNIAFEIVFQEIAGKLRGKHVGWLIARLKNKLEVFEHGRVFTERVMETGIFPFIDLEPISYESRDFGLVEFTKVASQLHDEGGNLQGWAVALMIRSIRWDAFEKVLKDKLYLDKLWSVYSGPYDRILTGFQPYVQLIQDVTSVVTGENCSVVDLGAGTGNVTTALLAKGHRVTAVENNVGMLDHLGLKTRKNRDGLTIVKASVENLECLNDESFDAVVMVNVLYAVDDPLRCLREIHRILAPGGVLGFSTTHSETRLNELLETIKAQGRFEGADGRAMNDYNVLERVNRNIERTIARRHTREQYKDWVRDAGFEITRYEDSTYHKAVMLIHAKKIVPKALREDAVEPYAAAKPEYAELFTDSRSPASTPLLNEPYTQPMTRGNAQLAPVPMRAINRPKEEPATLSSVIPTTRNVAVGKGFFGRIKEHKRIATAVLGLFAVMAAAAAVPYVFHLSSSGRTPLNSVAILPFLNATNDPNKQYLAEGIGDSLIDGLSRLPDLKVCARNLSSKHVGQDVDPQEVARALSVVAIVTGKVEQVGDKLRIRAWLVDARAGAQIWGDKYDRREADLSQLPSEITMQIAERLRLPLTSSEREMLTKETQADPRAYDLLLQGRFHQQQEFTKEGIKKAIELFSQALVFDSNYAPANAALAAAYVDLIYGSYIDPKQALPTAQAAAKKALNLDESLADSHIVMARINLVLWDWDGAEREIKRALELGPNLAAVHTVYWLFLSGQGRHNQAIAEAKLARDLSPPLALIYSANVGYALYFAGRYDQAIEQLKKTLELDSEYGFANVILGYVYAAKGMYADAIDEYKKAIVSRKYNTSDQCYLGYAMAKAGHRGEAEAILRQLQKIQKEQKTQKEQTEYVSPGELAALYAGLDMKNQALESLERAYDERDLQMQYLKAEQHYDSLRTEPRFTDLLKKVGLARSS